MFVLVSPAFALICTDADELLADAAPSWLAEHAVLRDKLEDYAKRLKPKLRHPLKKHREVGEDLPIGSGKNRITEILGAGWDADVFVIDTPEGPRAAKVYRSVEKFRRDVEWLNELRKQGVAVPEVYSVDEANRTVVMRRVRGIAWEELKKPTAENGLTAAEVEQIRAEMVSQLLGPDKPSINAISVNIVLDLDTGKFVVIDPL